MSSWEEKIRELDERRARLHQGGGYEAIKKLHERGKRTARERIGLLFDPDTFQELELWGKPVKTGFADIDERELPGDAVITGFGEINGRPAFVSAEDFTVLGGTMATTHSRKVQKVKQRALKAKVPMISIYHSGGVRIQDAVTSDPNSSYAPMFYWHTISSGVIPQISLIMGHCAAGAAYTPALTDIIIMVKDTSYMYIASPALVKSATFIETDDEKLGGAKVHATISGCSDLTAADDEDCIRLTHKLLSYLPQNNREKPPFVDTGDDPNRRENALLDIVPTESRKYYDMHRVIELIVDKGSFMELKPDFARHMITGLARFGGNVVGMIANNPMHLGGVIDIHAADKEARFIRFCDCFNIPLIFLCDNPGYLPGINQEHGGIIRHGAKVLYAICEATVPKITCYIRKAYGGGRPAMGSEPVGADLLLAWPTAELGLMGVEQAVDIIYRKGIAAAKNPIEARQQKIKEYSESLGKYPYHAGHQRWVEEIIDPRTTRPRLIAALKVFSNKSEERPWKKHGNIPL